MYRKGCISRDGRTDDILHCFPPAALEYCTCLHFPNSLKKAWIYVQLMTGDTYPCKTPSFSICHWTHQKQSKVYLSVLAFILHLPWFWHRLGSAVRVWFQLVVNSPQAKVKGSLYPLCLIYQWYFPSHSVKPSWRLRLPNNAQTHTNFCPLLAII